MRFFEILKRGIRGARSTFEIDVMECELIKANHPIVYSEIASLWGSKRCRTYLSNLAFTQDGCEGRRVFDFKELLEIESLKDQHDKQFRHFKPIAPVRDVWDSGR